MQVHGTLELLGGSLDGEYSTEVSSQGTPLPSASIKRLDKAEKMAESIGVLLSSALSRPSYRAAWTLIDKVLNKALDYDARIFSPESFSDLALRLDHAVRKSLTEIVNVAHLTEAEYECMTLEATRGGCGITPAALKASFAHVAASCQVLPLVGQTLLDMGWMKQEIENSISFEGIHQYFDLLRVRGIYLGVDGSVHDELPAHPMTGLSILWGQARKMYGVISRKLQHHVELNLRDRYVGAPRNLARLNSCSGNVSSKWLQSSPSSWWPTFSDDSFIMALRFRCGIQVVPVGQKCAHCKLSVGHAMCKEDLDIYGDHCVTCGIGGHRFTLHGALNQILAEAGRAAGYTALLEQVIPELAQVKVLEDGSTVIKDAILDVELFGHPIAPDLLLDGTIRHPCSVSALLPASRDVGYTAEEGVKVKLKRYPPKHGKAVLACSMETLGHTSRTLDAILVELAGLAGRRQRGRGIQPTKWLQKWRTHVSLVVAMHLGRTIVDALPLSERYWRCGGVIYSAADAFDNVESVPSQVERDTG